MSLRTEQDLLSELEGICAINGIKVEVNPSDLSLNKRASVDVEHDESGELVGIGLYDGARSLYFTSVTKRVVDLFIDLEIIAHNGKGDFESLRQWGIPVQDSQLVWDSELISHIVDSSRKGYGLKKLAKEDLVIEYPSYDDIVGTHKGKTKKSPKCPQIQSTCCGRKTLDKWPIRVVALYNGLDTFCTFKLYQLQKKIINHE